MTSAATVAVTDPAKSGGVVGGRGGDPGVARSGGPNTAPLPGAAHPPETLEGWYAVHQVLRVARDSVRGMSPEARRAMGESAVRALVELSEFGGGDDAAGWTAVVQLTGSVADVMVLHFRPTLDAVGEAQRRLGSEQLFDHLVPVTSFLSVAEAGLYHISAAVAAARRTAGGVVGDAEYRATIAERAAAERANPQVRRRLYPPLPADMPYICFYPMSKRRAVGQNWYALTLDERSRLMQAHGQTGRRYAGRVQQVITGAIGLDVWEWGVTLFARDPLEFKRLVTDMRFDEVSAQYAEFGSFYVGRVVSASEWVAAVVGV